MKLCPHGRSPKDCEPCFEANLAKRVEAEKRNRRQNTRIDRYDPIGSRPGEEYMQRKLKR